MKPPPRTPDRVSSYVVLGLLAVLAVCPLAVRAQGTGPPSVPLPPEVAEAIAHARTFETYVVEAPVTAFGEQVLVADELVFEAGATLRLDPGGVDFVAIQAAKLVMRDGATRSRIEHADAELLNGGSGGPGSPGWTGRAPFGRPGGPGGPGGEGDPGDSWSPPPLYLIVENAVDEARPSGSDLAMTIDLHGWDGKNGGSGGRGGPGGHGEEGVSAYAGGPDWCERPPGNGGDGGTGGVGGRGGAAGVGGDGGTVYLGGSDAFKAMASRFSFELNGGRPGKPGPPGPPGPGGDPGPAGQTGPPCPTAESGTAGADGALGGEGDPGSPGKAGHVVLLSDPDPAR